LSELKTVGLFALTALAEIAGCYLPYLWLREGKSVWLLIPGALSLIAFVWLLSLHPAAAGRVYEPPRLYRRVIYLSQAAMPDRVKLS